MGPVDSDDAPALPAQREYCLWFCPGRKSWRREVAQLVRRTPQWPGDVRARLDLQSRRSRARGPLALHARSAGRRPGLRTSLPALSLQTNPYFSGAKRSVGSSNVPLASESTAEPQHPLSIRIYIRPGTT